MITVTSPEKTKRIFLALWAYAYEIENDPLVPDSVYDKIAHSIDVNVSTGNKTLDIWFKRNFVADTGQWIHIHPGIERLKQIYNNITKGDNKCTVTIL